jgi:hypothetical protein
VVTVKIVLLVRIQAKPADRAEERPIDGTD